MKLLEKFLKFSRGKQITVAVFAFHFAAILALLGHHLASQRFRPVRPMVVRTLAAQAAPIAVASAPIAIAKTPAPVKPKAAPVPAVKKATVTAAKPVVKAVAKKDPVLQEIAESLQALSTEAARPRTELKLPSKLPAKTEIAPSKLDPTYGEALVAYLQNELDLPEYGEVRAKIEIDRFGSLVRCEILESKSAKNATFLKNRLPELTFPCLNEDQSFTITFRNVEIR